MSCVLAWAGNKLAMQEFMVLPTGADTFGQALQMGCEVYHHLKVWYGTAGRQSSWLVALSGAAVLTFTCCVAFPIPAGNCNSFAM